MSIKIHPLKFKGLLFFFNLNHNHRDSIIISMNFNLICLNYKFKTKNFVIFGVVSSENVEIDIIYSLDPETILKILHNFLWSRFSKLLGVL